MTDFFNVIIGGHKKYAFPEDRIFEETQKSVSALFKDEDGDPDFHKLQQLPTIMTPEYDEDRPATARIGYLGQDNYDPYLETVVASFPAFKLNAFLPRNGWLGQRTRWIVLRGDPYRMLGNLQQQQITPVDSPFVMKFPEVAIEGRRIGVMMPFGVGYLTAGNDPVYKAIKDAASACDFKCVRADEYVSPEDIKKNILELIEGSKAIIVDLSGSNPNVFYEMGMAHARGRVVIPICEKDNSQTLPFDVSQFRTIFFHKDNDWGLKGLTDSLIQTLKVI